MKQSKTLQGIKILLQGINYQFHCEIWDKSIISLNHGSPQLLT